MGVMIPATSEKNNEDPIGITKSNQARIKRQQTHYITFRKIKYFLF
jgi:hypothetical protein